MQLTLTIYPSHIYILARITEPTFAIVVVCINGAGSNGGGGWNRTASEREGEREGGAGVVGLWVCWLVGFLLEDKLTFV